VTKLPNPALARARADTLTDLFLTHCSNSAVAVEVVMNNVGWDRIRKLEPGRDCLSARHSQRLGRGTS
jgi:hypothetical protein